MRTTSSSSTSGGSAGTTVWTNGATTTSLSGRVDQVERRMGALERKLDSLQLPTTKTSGEKTVDWIVDYGFGFFANYAASLAVSDIVDYGKDGFMAKASQRVGLGTGWAEWIHKKENWARWKFMSWFGIKENDQRHGRKFVTVKNLMSNVFDIAMLSWGGTLQLIPMGLINHRKEKLSRVADRLRDRLTGHKPDEAELAQREARYREIAETPSRSWGQLVWARIWGQGVNVATMFSTQFLDPKFWKDGDTLTINDEVGIRRFAYAGIDLAVKPMLRRKDGFENADYTNEKEAREVLAQAGMLKHRRWPFLIATDFISTLIVAKVMAFVNGRFDTQNERKAKAARSATTVTEPVAVTQSLTAQSEPATAEPGLQRQAPHRSADRRYVPPSMRAPAKRPDHRSRAAAEAAEREEGLAVSGLH